MKHHASGLAERPTWLFWSGPLDDSVAAGDIPPVKSVQALMEGVHARGHVAFGGPLPDDAHGLTAGAMAKKHAGDWRDDVQVLAWVDSIVPDLRKVSVA